MRNHIGRIFERLISPLLPPPAQHRAASTPPVSAPLDVPTVALTRVRDPYVWPMMRGEDAQLVRPYVLAHERRLERHECRCQAGLRCAAHLMAVPR